MLAIAMQEIAISTGKKSKNTSIKIAMKIFPFFS